MVPQKNISLRMCYKKVRIDGRTEEYISKRMEKIGRFLTKFSRQDYEAEIHRDKKGKFGVHMMIRTPYRLYRAEEKSESIEGSVDLAVENLQNQIIKDKDKLKELRERGARSIKKKTVMAADSRFRG
jgi:ribosomal subunit interface protein